MSDVILTRSKDGATDGEVQKFAAQQQTQQVVEHGRERHNGPAQGVNERVDAALCFERLDPLHAGL